MKILFVVEHYFPNVGGVEIVFKNLCEGLVSRGHKVHVVTSRLEGTKEKETINGVSIKRINTPSYKHARYFFTFFAVPYLLKVAKKYDIIHTTTYNGAPPTKLISLLYKKPSVITVHEIIGKDWEKVLGMSKFSAKMHQFLEWLIARLNFDKYVCVSKSTQKNVLSAGVKKKRTAVVYNALDYDTFDPKKYKKARKDIRDKLGLKNEFLYVFYGRPGVSKGPEYLINAIPSISKKIPGSKALFIMATEPRQRYKEMVKLIEKNADGNVILHKPLPYKELPKYLSAADAIVIPSITEGFGYCVAESCALGIPVVATNTTSIPEVASNKFLLVPPRNSKAIAKALEYVKTKKCMKTPLKKFTLDRFLDEYEDVYRSF